MSIRSLGLVRALAVTLVLAPAATAGAQVRIGLQAWTEPVLMDTLRQDHHLDAPPEKVYQAALRAYADLGIPTGNTDGHAGIIGSERFEQARSLAGAPMSRWFNCGESQVGQNADSFRLEIAVVTWVGVDGTGTKAGFATIASGRDVSGVYRNPKPCESTGALELKLLDRIRSFVGR